MVARGGDVLEGRWGEDRRQRAREVGRYAGSPGGSTIGSTMTASSAPTLPGGLISIRDLLDHVIDGYAIGDLRTMLATPIEPVGALGYRSR